jgi:hypothetical protein
MKQVRSFPALIRFLENLPTRKNKRTQRIRLFWAKFLEQEPKTHRKWEQAGLYAGNWELCACGVSLPRELRTDKKITEHPNDTLLLNLGANFATACREKNYPWARRIFKAIQNREAVLINELKRKNIDINFN